MQKRISVLAAVLLGAGLIAGCRAAEEIDFGPFFLKDRDIYGHQRWRALGPLLESRRAEDGNELLALRPFYSYAFNAAENIYRRQILYPVWLAKGQNDEHQWAFLLLFRYHDFDDGDPEAKYRLWLLPFYFQGRDIDGVPYLAIFPFAGSIREILGFNEIRFAMFPLTLYTRVDDVKTIAFLWPLISQQTGGDKERLNFFPFYGYSRLRQESEKRYFLWPFWTDARYHRPLSPGHSFVFFPFFGRVDTENQKSLMILPPLFRFSRGAQMDLVYCPWPIVQYSSGEINKLYFWPIWGRKSRDTSYYSFLLWPLCVRYRQQAPFYEHARFMFFPFVYSSSTRGSFDDPQRKLDEPRETLKIWPFFSYARDRDERRFTMLSLFPFRDYDAIERNYGALWTLYSHTACAGQTEDELLWGLARLRNSASETRFSLFPLISVSREKASGRFDWSLFKGLIAREKAGAQRKIRLLYFIRF